LYAISPDIRQYLKDNVTTRRINIPNIASTNTLEEIEEDLPAVALLQGASSSPDLLIAQLTVELRTIPVKLEGNVEVEAILDDGSQVISIRRDVWEKLKSPIHTNQAMTMESANGSRDRIMGLLPNLRVVIGECDFYLQVQVIESASFEMLLGRPFFTLAQASTRHFFSGDSHITLLDPNSAKAVTLPTRPHVHPVSDFQ